MDLSLLHPLNRLLAGNDWLEDPLVAYADDLVLILAEHGVVLRGRVRPRSVGDA
jgi:hypothetical protein